MDMSGSSDAETMADTGRNDNTSDNNNDKGKMPESSLDSGKEANGIL